MYEIWSTCWVWYYRHNKFYVIKETECRNELEVAHCNSSYFTPLHDVTTQQAVIIWQQLVLKLNLSVWDYMCK